MLSDIKKLFSIASKEERTILGLMSGTSLDGLDMALCKISGNGKNTKVQLLQKVTVPYETSFQNELRKIFSQKEGSIELLTILHSHIGLRHGQMILDQLKLWNATTTVDLIASHGQTIYHAPMSKHQYEGHGNATLQIGDADHIAVVTGVITISDFRMKHIAAGGEGAPLAVYGDYFLFSDAIENRIMLNIGGIANFTWLPNTEMQSSRPCFTSDIGPGNTLIDSYIRAHYLGYSYDDKGAIAAKGKVNKTLFNHLISHPFFNVPIPKSTGQETFNLDYVYQALGKLDMPLSHEDVVCTLTYLTSYCIAAAINTEIGQLDQLTIFPSGGGIHNHTMMEYLHQLLPTVVFKDVNHYGIDADAKEAVLFAILANECVSGQPLHSNTNQVALIDTSMGKISFP